jgi:hypothetical protein
MDLNLLDMDRQHVHGQAACTWTGSMYMDRQHVHGGAACTWISSIDMNMQREQGHTDDTLAAIDVSAEL